MQQLQCACFPSEYKSVFHMSERRATRSKTQHPLWSTDMLPMSWPECSQMIINRKFCMNLNASSLIKNMFLKTSLWCIIVVLIGIIKIAFVIGRGQRKRFTTTYATYVVSSNPVHGEVYSIRHYVIKFVSDLWQVSGFLRVPRFPPPIKLTATI